MKRSKSIKIALMGATVFSMTACDQPSDVAAIFENVDQCVQANADDANHCESQWQKAEEEHIRSAPKYTRIEDCQADFGDNQCQTAPQQTTSGGSVFMPLMAGYMMGSLLSGGTYSNVATQPLYKSRDDGATFRTADNKGVTSKTGIQTVSRTVVQSPSTKTTTIQRGGFGGTAFKKTSGFNSFGG